MIYDNIKELSRYHIPMSGAILEFLKKHESVEFSEPEIEIAGRDLFVRLSSYQTRLPAEGRFETHEIYADLQYIVSGSERMQVAPLETLAPATGYDHKKDMRFYDGGAGITDIIVRQGEFVLFFPGEAHRPMCRCKAEAEAVKKLVFKIKWK